MNYTIIAGVNGAGKSVFYHSGQVNKDKLGIRVNVDELIQKEYDNKWDDLRIQLKAGREIVRKIESCIENKLSFNQETTLAGKSIINTIKKAKKVGYAINLYYIGVESFELAIKRVSRRVRLGGHGIPDEVIKKRYYKSLENLQEILPICDNVFIYDNSIIKKNILIVENKEIIFKSNIPEYLRDYVKAYIENISIDNEDNIIEDDWDLEV